MSELHKSTTVKPGYREHYNVNSNLSATNVLDPNGNPTGGHVTLQVKKGEQHQFPCLLVNWQDGPRGTAENGTLTDPNGAFVEDVLWAALQRLEFFNESKYRDRANSLAITHIESALQALKNRQLERSHRNVEGKHEV